jgi:hypothetical protein
MSAAIPGWQLAPDDDLDLLIIDLLQGVHAKAPASQ